MDAYGIDLLVSFNDTYTNLIAIDSNEIDVDSSFSDTDSNEIDSHNGSNDAYFMSLWLLFCIKELK